MGTSIKVIIGEWVRKIIVGACGSAITWIVVNKVATQEKAEELLGSVVEIVVLSAFILGAGLWSRVILPWIQSKVSK